MQTITAFYREMDLRSLCAGFWAFLTIKKNKIFSVISKNNSLRFYSIWVYSCIAGSREPYTFASKIQSY